jgi:hypothetical protein
MNEYHISAFIDDELDLDEKMAFVETVHADATFKDETLVLLRQEKKLRSPATDRIPGLAFSRPRFNSPRIWLKPLGWVGWGLTAALLLIVLQHNPTPIPTQVVSQPHRFVLYQPDIRTAALVGSFTHWQALAMERTGAPGYWEINVSLPQGEHRYIFLIDGHRQITDPTRLSKERDDFGNLNSIISIKSNNVL